MNIYLVCEVCEYEGVQRIIKAFNSRPKAEKFVIDTEAFKARNKEKYHNLIKWFDTLAINKISEFMEEDIPKDMTIEDVLNKYYNIIPNEKINEFEQECLSSFTTEERKIFEFDFNNNKLEITEMEVE